MSARKLFLKSAVFRGDETTPIGCNGSNQEICDRTSGAGFNLSGRTGPNPLEGVQVAGFTFVNHLRPGPVDAARMSALPNSAMGFMVGGLFCRRFHDRKRRIV
jgi:hypothetical protein